MKYCILLLGLCLVACNNQRNNQVVCDSQKSNQKDTSNVYNNRYTL